MFIYLFIFTDLWKLTFTFLILSPPLMLFENVFVGDFPGGPVVKNPPSCAGDAGSIPGRGTKIPHAAGQLSLCTATTEATRHN